MKHIIRHKSFIKSYNKIIRAHPNLEERINERIEMFVNNRDSDVLRDHGLLGSKLGNRSFSVAGNIRIIYKELEKDYFLFVEIGTHNQVYN